MFLAILVSNETTYKNCSMIFRSHYVSVLFLVVGGMETVFFLRLADW